MNDFLTLRLNARELDYIVNTLADQKWREVNALMVNIQGQVQYQQKEQHHGSIDAEHSTDGSGQSAKLASVGGGG